MDKHGMQKRRNSVSREDNNCGQIREWPIVSHVVTDFPATFVIPHFLSIYFSQLMCTPSLSLLPTQQLVTNRIISILSLRDDSYVTHNPIVNITTQPCLRTMPLVSSYALLFDFSFFFNLIYQKIF